MNSSQLRNIRIILLFGNLELGGAERQGFLLATYLKNKCGAHVQIWGLQPEPGRLSELCDEVGIPWKGVPFIWPVQFYLSYLRIKSLIKLGKLFREEQPDILVPYTYLPNVVCGLIWEFTGAKVCVWNQEDEGLCLNKSFWHRLSVRWTPCFISNSTGGKNFLMETYRVPSEKILVIHNGIKLPTPVRNRETWRKSIGVADDCFVACMLANFHEYKDHATLIRSWYAVLNRVKREKNPPVLLLAGRFDEGMDKLKKLAGDLELDDTIKFIGGVDDVAGLLQSVDLCVHSSKSEGLPNSVLEAMAAGLPVVATDIPGIREAVGPEGSPFLAPPEEPKPLADKIEFFFRNPDARAKVGERMRRRVHEKFDLSLMCTKTASFISRELARRT